jgi:hypothetical protein
MFNFKAAGIVSGLATVGLLVLTVFVIINVRSVVGNTFAGPLFIAAGLGWVSTILCAIGHDRHRAS